MQGNCEEHHEAGQKDRAAFGKVWILGFATLFSFMSSGAFDPKISEMAKGARNNKFMNNSSRHLDTYIGRTRQALNVPWSYVDTPLRARAFSRRKMVVTEPWPVLKLTDWMKTSMEDPWQGFFMLGGYKLDNLSQAESMFERFWQRFEALEGYAPPCPKRTVPIYLHGDEGRGQAKRPILIVAFQPLITWAGEEHSNLRKRLGPIEHACM